MALMYSNGMAIGTPMPPFALKGTDGRTWSPDDFAEAAVLVVVFTCNHCPYAIASEDRLIALHQEYSESGVRFVLINPNDAARYPDDSFDYMIQRAREKDFPFPYLHDETQEVARAFDAACTPDLFVFDAARRLTYNGRIDDNWQEPRRASRHDLRNAIEATLAGREIKAEDRHPSMGCSIKWK
ncbi:MAG: thioredoxin family protein [Bacteroidia bacterium]|nr:thioredoxin family protein [Bacteroidia bacterium]